MELGTSMSGDITGENNLAAVAQVSGSGVVQACKGKNWNFDENTRALINLFLFS